jgi:glycosyltransferase involved in cell wall biosynthesis
MRVLHVIGSGAIGGAEGFVVRLALLQRRESGVEPELLFATSEGPLTETAREEGLAVHCFGGKPKGTALREAVRLMREFDLLHFHGLYSLHFLAAIVSGTPAIYQVHGVRALTKGVGAVLRGAMGRSGTFRFPTLAGAGRFLRRQWLKVFLRGKAKEIIAPSEYYAGFFSSLYSVPRKRITVVRLGVAPEALEPGKAETEVRGELGLEGARVVGCVSTFRKLKRIDRLVDGFARLDGLMGETPLRLLIVGDGEERENLEAQIRGQEMEGKVVLAGLRRDVADLLQVMDLFVLPSERESFSLALCEAMHAGLPVLAFAGSGGAAELVEMSGGGKVVSDANMLAREMKSLLERPEEAKRLGEAGRRFAAANLTLERTAAEFAGIYRRVTHARGAA